MSEFATHVLRAAAVAPEPFLIPDLIVQGRRLNSVRPFERPCSEMTEAFHIVRDAVDRGELERRNDGYWRVSSSEPTKDR